MTTLTDINGIGPALAKRLESAGIITIGQVASTVPDVLAEVQGVSVGSAVQIIVNAKKFGEFPAEPKVVEKSEPVAQEGRVSVGTKTQEVEVLERKVEKLETKVVKLKKALAKATKPAKGKSLKNGKKSKKRKKK